MEISVCARLRTRSPRILAQLKKLSKTRMTARFEIFKKADASEYVELFGGGPIKTHLHVNLLIRPNNWKAGAAVHSLIALKKSLQQFVDVKADLMIDAEFMLSISELPSDGFIRSAMKETNIRGVKARRTGESYVAKVGEPIFRVRWSDFGDGYVLVTVGIKESMRIGPSYLADSKAAILKAFRTFVIAENSNVQNNK